MTTWPVPDSGLYGRQASSRARRPLFAQPHAFVPVDARRQHGRAVGVIFIRGRSMQPAHRVDEGVAAYLDAIPRHFENALGDHFAHRP
jgi:hypothetical protein